MSSSPPGLFWRVLLSLAALVALPGQAASGEVPRLAQIQASGELRVCFWPNYHGIGFRDPRSGQITGLDADLARELAQQLKVRVKWVDTSFTQFIPDLQSDLCDVAMMGVTVTPQRATQVDFSEPYLRTDFYAVTTRNHLRVRQWSDIDQPGIRVAVAAGAVHETVLRERLRYAELVVVRPPRTREGELEAGRVDVFMSDYPFTTRLQETNDWLQVLAPPSPYHLMDYAWAIRQGDPAWRAALNQFLALIKHDGRLRRVADRYRLSRMLILDSLPKGRPR